MKKLLLILAVPLLMGAGCAVEKNTNTSRPDHIEVSELGFKIPISGSIADEVVYKVDDSAAKFSTKTLNAASKHCESGGGIISKISGTPDNPGDGNAEWYSARLDNVKQFDGFFLFYSHPQAVCAKDYQDLQTKLIEAIGMGLTEASLIN